MLRQQQHTSPAARPGKFTLTLQGGSDGLPGWPLRQLSADAAKATGQASLYRSELLLHLLPQGAVLRCEGLQALLQLRGRLQLQDLHTADSSKLVLTGTPAWCKAWAKLEILESNRNDTQRAATRPVCQSDRC